MSILKVSKLGNPVLRKTAEPVSPDEIKRPEFQKFIDDMVETMHEYDGVGLAAPQVHESKQVAVIEVQGSRRYPEAPDIPLLVLINPVFLDQANEKNLGWEGCLSIEGFRGQTPRAAEVKVKALDRDGKEFILEASGFLAVVIQHELDHLMGKVFLDRMTDFSTLTHLKEYERFWLKEEE
jgi:peptide deformylase